jgi:hypothetical protein
VADSPAPRNSAPPAYPARPPEQRQSAPLVRTDLVPGVTVLFVVALLGVPLGWLWSALAPPTRARALPGLPEPAPLPLESWHEYDDLAVLTLLGLAAGVIVGIVLWLMRERRGPVTLVAAVAGSVLSAWLATLLGPSFAAARYPVGTPAAGEVVTLAPDIGTLWVLVAQPMAVALVYGTLAAWNGRDDLGRRLG